MSFDLDEEELKATRILNGVAKEEIEVGEYVRYDDGIIHKVNNQNRADIENYFFKETKIIVNHSKNIIDLIEVGDIVHTRDVLNEDYYYMFDEEMIKATKETIQEGIELVDILTKEQYNKNCYVV